MVGLPGVERIHLPMRSGRCPRVFWDHGLSGFTLVLCSLAVSSESRAPSAENPDRGNARREGSEIDLNASDAEHSNFVLPTVSPKQLPSSEQGCEHNQKKFHLQAEAARKWNR